MNQLQRQLRNIDHRGYPAYKDLKGRYHFQKYTLHIEHVQGDPFASPSNLSVEIKGNVAGFPKEYYGEYHRRVALQDYLLRGFARGLDQISFQAKGSGKSGLVAASHPGQEILERSACHIDKNSGDVLFRFVVGFPARGRSIAAGELEKILFQLLPPVVGKQGIYASLPEKKVREVIELADDQKALREEMAAQGLVAFVANDSILPRESGVSERPMRNAIPFQSPASMEVTLSLPHKGDCKGMGIKKGVTLIVGGGYHGKSTLLQTLEKSVYPHIAGDGREYIATEATGMKIRAEDGRSVCREDISLFIRNLPNGKDTSDFSTLDASGSTSQATNTMEALETGSKLLLIDEDTSATNFMIRDELMEQVIAAEEEPIVPFIKRVGELYQQKDVSTILVVGSCGAFFHVADTVIQMEKYLPKEITQAAREKAKAFPLAYEPDDVAIDYGQGRKVRLPRADDRTKIKVMSTDGFSYNKRQVDLRYLEQVTDGEQMLAIAKCLEYLEKKYGGKEMELSALLRDVEQLLEKQGVAGLCARGSVPNMAMPRKLEISGCINRYIKCK
ncbi:MAG: ABC-ATPase domain-containing protein [Lachnospiraceae bacterium]|nr:ABC-ATPase domain-containing protein [Lachnospiraceae bacterium]